KAIYTPLLNFALRFRWLALGAAVVLFGSSLWVFTRLGAEFIPQLDEGTMLLQFIRSSSAGLVAEALDRQSCGCEVDKRSCGCFTHNDPGIRWKEHARKQAGPFLRNLNGRLEVVC